MLAIRRIAERGAVLRRCDNICFSSEKPRHSPGWAVFAWATRSVCAAGRVRARHTQPADDGWAVDTVPPWIPIGAPDGRGDGPEHMWWRIAKNCTRPAAQSMMCVCFHASIPAPQLSRAVAALALALPSEYPPSFDAVRPGAFIQCTSQSRQRNGRLRGRQGRFAQNWVGAHSTFLRPRPYVDSAACRSHTPVRRSVYLAVREQKKRHPEKVILFRQGDFCTSSASPHVIVPSPVPPPPLTGIM